MATNKKTIDWYNQNAREYADHVKNGSGAFHWGLEKPAMYSQLPRLEGKAVLSVGCGAGHDSAELKKRGVARSVGIDISKELIKIAKTEHPECEFSVMDMQRLSFEDATFDFVYSSLAMHYLDKWEVALAEIYRVLKPGGFFLFSREHPIWTAQAKYEVESKVKLKGARVMHDYLNPQTIGGMGDMDVITYQLPISRMINDLVKAGFQIIKCEEPAPTKEFKKIADPSKYDLLTRIPIFITFKVQKPE